MPRLWVLSPIIGSGSDTDPYRPQVADRSSTAGDRLEFIIPTNATGQPTFPEALVAASVTANDLSALTDRIADALSLDTPLAGGERTRVRALATRLGLTQPDTARDLIRAVGQRAQPWFDERGHLGAGTINPTGSFMDDTFTDANSTLLENHAVGEIGATWTKHPNSLTGNGLISTNRLWGDAADVLYYASGVPASAEYDVDAIFFCYTVFGGSSVTARMDTAANSFYMIRPQGATWELQKRVTGTFTSLGTWVDTPAANDTRVSQFQVRDATKKLFVGGVEQISTTDNAVTGAGRIGFRAGAVGTSASRWVIDRLTGTDLDLSATETMRVVQSNLRW